MKPYQILLFLCSVFLLLFILTLVFPESGIRIGKEIHLKFKTFDSFLKKDTIKYADISILLKSTDNSKIINEPVVQGIEENEPTIEVNKTGVFNVDSLRSITRPIEISTQNPGTLFPIFEDLYNLNSTKKLIRILHYGDSQIESDRITSYLRNKMQLLFGGSGCGLVSPVPLYNGLISIKQEYSSNWERYTGYIKNENNLEYKKYGALMSFARQNFTNPDPISKKKSWLSYSPSSLGYSNSRKFNRVSLFLTNRIDTVSLKVMIKDSLIESRVLEPKPELTKLNWKFKKTPEELLISFEGKESTELYGISFDNSWGVAVDNIPLRGSSGLFFSKTDTVFLENMYKKLNVRMLILQFGGNIVPLQASDYNFYEKYFTRELNIIKRILPKVPVIVIGPSDMSIKEDDSYVTYPNLTNVRNALKNASLNSGYAFWDMYEAMGGENSMPSWVYANPPLAVPDFVHFNYRGAKVIAEMFYNAFLIEYNSWLNAAKYTTTDQKR